ncbi:MAG: cyclic nucleotide-binding domain-containing protein [Gammaproteobacteria bacterium]
MLRNALGSDEPQQVAYAIEMLSRVAPAVLASETETLAAIAREQLVAQGDTFIHEGTMENHLYVVVNGDVEILIGDKVVQRRGAGTVVGEMQIIDPAPRSATVRAATETMLFRVGRESFEQLMAERPEIARAINRMLVRRLRAASAGN